jgi:hypothetical protein
MVLAREEGRDGGEELRGLRGWVEGERGRIKALLCVTCTPCTQQRLDSTSL